MSEFIYNFISSLSKSEKAYFKKQAKAYSNNQEKNYLRLFDAIDKMDRYDKNRLQVKFADEPLGKYLSSEINYLFDQILKSLVNFSFDTSVKKKLQKTILSIEILLEKGFQKRALKILYKSKELAYRLEDFTTILELIQIEEEVLFKLGILGFTTQLAILSQERETVNSKIQNLNKLRLMREEIRELQFSNVPFKEISGHPHFHLDRTISNDVTALSNRAKEHWYYIITLGCYLIQDYVKAKEVSEEYIAFLEGGDFKQRTILTAISNHLYYCALEKDETAFSDMLNRLDKLKQNPVFDKVFISYMEYARGLELHYQTNNSEAALSLINHFESSIRTNLSELGTTQGNYALFLTVRSYLISEQYHTALEWLSLWQQQGVLKYTLVYSRMFSMIIHLELGWHDLLETEIDATYKVLKRQNKYGDLSRAFLGFFRSQLNNPKGLSKSLAELEEKLVNIYAELEKRQNFEYFNFLDWCQNKRKKLNNT